MSLTVGRPSVPAQRYADRLGRARVALAANGADALLIGVGSDLVYLTGYVAMPLERLTMLVLPPTGSATLVAPRLEAMAAAISPAGSTDLVEIVPWDETDDAHALVADRLRSRPSRVLVGDKLWAMHVLGLQAAMPGTAFGLATDVLRTLRTRKDADEVALLRAAARAADRVVMAIAHGPLIGRTEADVSQEIADRLRDEGHDFGEFGIVASGPNAASPHHSPADRRIEAGEPVVLDLGGPLGGYKSDTTRTVWLAGPDGSKPPDPEFLRIYDLVKRANEAAEAAVRPGASCAELDGIARRVITDGGYGPQFLHRLGHGIGLETHEEPYLVAGSPDKLAEGTTFSVEPGIYLEGRYGVRIEDIVACGAGGADVLNETTHELMVVTG
ncbi:MAG TPA: Xaa-Pro peptidase family protein [Candidatus Limnocylindrales bacterium]|nr:Xaa-Pro peptidase family protein [Candidatus Limnocylindrales bacterium]